MRNGTVRLQARNLLQHLSNRQGQWSSIKNCLGSRKTRLANRSMTEAVWVRSSAERGEQTVLCEKPRVKPQHLPITWTACEISAQSHCHQVVLSPAMCPSETSDLDSQTGDKKRMTQNGVWMSSRWWKGRIHLEVLLLNPSEALGSRFSSAFCQELGCNGGWRDRCQDPVGKRWKGWMRPRVKKDEWNMTEWAPLHGRWPWRSINPRHCSLVKEMVGCPSFPGQECHDLGTESIWAGSYIPVNLLGASGTWFPSSLFYCSQKEWAGMSKDKSLSLHASKKDKLLRICQNLSWMHLCISHPLAGLPLVAVWQGGLAWKQEGDISL